jgi:hypothetical protein
MHEQTANARRRINGVPARFDVDEM